MDEITPQPNQIAVPQEIGATLPNPSTEVAVEREIAYRIKDSYVPRLAIYKSANAWWMDSKKVHKIIYLLKEGHLIKDAIFKTGISQGQWEYFNDIHPDFSGVIEACRSYQRFPAMHTVNRALTKNPDLSFRWLTKRHPDFKTEQKVELPPMVQQTVNITSQEAQHVDTTKIENLLERVAEGFLAGHSRAAGVPGNSGQSVEEVHP